MFIEAAAHLAAAVATTVPDSSSSGAASVTTPPRLEVELSDPIPLAPSAPEQAVVLTSNDMVLTSDSQTAGTSYADLALQDESVLTQQVSSSPIPIMGQDDSGDVQETTGDTLTSQPILSDPMVLQGVFQQSPSPTDRGPPLVTTGPSDDSHATNILPSPPVLPSDPQKGPIGF